MDLDKYGLDYKVLRDGTIKVHTKLKVNVSEIEKEFEQCYLIVSKDKVLMGNADTGYETLARIFYIVPDDNKKLADKYAMKVLSGAVCLYYRKPKPIVECITSLWETKS